MIERIFLDLDDVLNRFTMYALKHVGCQVDVFDASGYYDYHWGFDIVHAANILGHYYPLPYVAETFWEQIGREVWANCPVSDECYELIETCARVVGKGNLCILTSPIKDPECAAGKMEWIHRNLPPWLHRQFFIGTPKHLCASPSALLIDDCDANVNCFMRNGGQVILFPRPWNIAHGKCTKDTIHEISLLNLQ